MRSLLATLCLTALPAIAAASTGEVVVDLGDMQPTAASGPAILYVNGCFGSGCQVRKGAESSIENSSSLIKGDVHLSPYAFGQAHFDQVLDCVQEIYAPFGITVTKFDPGQTPHFETFVSGSPTALGFPAEVAGAAPFSCQVIPNAVSFVFPGRLDGDVRRICETIAHESSHAWGLEHSLMCEDTMTYLSGCGAKGFVDLEVDCGEDAARPCVCGTKQNSYRKLMEQFGPSNPTPPSIQLMAPEQGARVEQSFRVLAEASDDVGVRAVELWIDGVRVDTDQTPPFEFEAPTVTPGPHLIEVIALDDVYTPAKAVAQIKVGTACSSDDDCAGHEVCAGDICVTGPGVAGGLGASCQDGTQCESQLCFDSGDQQVCTLPCGPGQNECPSGFACEAFAAGDPMCVPAGGGCSVSSASGNGLWFLSLFAIAIGLRRRRS